MCVCVWVYQHTQPNGSKPAFPTKSSPQFTSTFGACNQGRATDFFFNFEDLASASKSAGFLNVSSTTFSVAAILSTTSLRACEDELVYEDEYISGQGF